MDWNLYSILSILLWSFAGNVRKNVSNVNVSESVHTVNTYLIVYQACCG